MKKLHKYILGLLAILTLSSCSEKINQLDNSFTNSFCKVEFVCYQNEPNWLGMIVLIIGFIILAVTIIVMFFKD